MKNISIIVFLLFLICNSCKQKTKDWIDRSKHEGLYNITLSNDFETYASIDQPNHLKTTINNLELAKSYFDKVFNEDLNFAVLFVDNQNWDTYAFVPTRGMPQAYYKGNIVLGLDKSEMAIGFEQALNQMPPQATQELKKYFDKPINLDGFFRDGLALHELGHLYQFYKTGDKNQRRWLNELFGNLCQIGAARSFDDLTTFNQMNSFQNLLIRGNQWGNLKYKTLTEFEINYFDVMKEGRNYGWYQTRFFIIAKALHDKYGDNIISKFRAFMIDISLKNKLDDKTLNELMLKEFGSDVMDLIKWNY